MQKYKILIAYDGTNFHGWQIQPTAVTVTSCLEKTFKRVFGKTISLFGASRTDSGVHALGQVAQFTADIDIDAEIMREAWNENLPISILIRRIEKVPESFHPCHNVKQKVYLYHLFLKRPLPHLARYGWFYRFAHLVDWEKFKKGLNLYVGTHDFASFCKNDEGKETVRTIDSIRVRRILEGSVVQVEVRGKSFLRFQIRRMIGYALDVARRKDFSVGYLQSVLDSKNPQQTLVKAGAGGLCLRKIIYDDRVY